MLLTGLPISAQEASQKGLVTKVCPSEKLDQEIEEIVNAIRSKSRDVIELGKRFYYTQIQYDVKKAYMNWAWTRWWKIYRCLIAKKVFRVLLRRENHFGEGTNISFFLKISKIFYFYTATIFC